MFSNAEVRFAGDEERIMKYTKFTINRYKGIPRIELELSKKPSSNIFTLVGLNESGKTSILEAIYLF